tara:strand:+ start:9013 stop:9333 length:321 start_codon:yes stop_codon:yes gene_type:complete
MASFDYNEEQLTNILNSYKNKKEKEKERYERIKDTEEYKIENRERARIHYSKYKEKKKVHYENNKDFFRARNSFYYYRKTKNLQKFIDNFPERVELLESVGFTVTA